MKKDHKADLKPSQTQFPVPLFKFHSDNEFLEKIFKNSQLWISNPNHFNDIFDCRWSIDTALIKEKHKADPHYKKPGVISTRQQRREFDRLFEKMIDDDDYMEKQYKEMTKTFRIGVCCFTQKVSNDIFWAFYADSFKGVCLEFDFRGLNTDEGIPNFYPVTYSDEIVQLRSFDPQHVMIPLRTKKKCYSFEAEWRVIHAKGDTPFPFAKPALKAVYFGKRMSTDRINELKKMIKSLGYKVKFYKMKTYYNKSNYDFFELKK